ncbi:cytochrome d ubiquinol oxidase subunit II [Williamsia sterculiae]|uniref:Cytochrome bd-I ubiquinol oxidase subunit 2 apoprotein n=1 Tax=Williamsia sterculiae TaxID=1344003 RepID=A0A1N7GXA1_9NOCA|nr:cytochrome d ubiquinol oxidase subunit II [Williamsia sterculiae]SIS17227.1 cytochrome bd-I ubiquinol oxidase subunit 2 apoprotein [Williamsia sterculiae]
MSLPELWFLIIAFLFGGYFLLEGFDFGVGILMSVVGRGHDPDDGDTRRRVLLATIGPVWDGNEVWLITAGAGLFAAFPEWYASMFSGFYLMMFAIVISLILRVCAIEWRGKIDDPRWRRVADVGIGAGSWVPAVLWGIVFANIVEGMALDQRHIYTGGFWDLLNPYALLGGLTTLLVFAAHGAIFLGLKTAGEVRVWSVAYARYLSVPAGVVAGGFLLWTQLAHGKTWTWIPVAVAAVAVLVLVVGTWTGRSWMSFAATSVAILGTVVTLFGSLWRDVMPSTTDPAYSLTIDNASSTHYTLVVMTWAAVCITPIVMGYQAWTYWVFRQRISTGAIPPSIGLSVRPAVARAVAHRGLGSERGHPASGDGSGAAH